ncbi:MAG: hypothetical protein CMK89_09065 [Pseudomonadales bacterium]|nr:hypothetical protein [Pseudomonadales bacterium]
MTWASNLAWVSSLRVSSTTCIATSRASCACSTAIWAAAVALMRQRSWAFISFSRAEDTFS